MRGGLFRTRTVQSEDIGGTVVSHFWAQLQKAQTRKLRVCPLSCPARPIAVQCAHVRSVRVVCAVLPIFHTLSCPCPLYTTCTVFVQHCLVSLHVEMDMYSFCATCACARAQKHNS